MFRRYSLLSSKTIYYVCLFLFFWLTSLTPLPSSLLFSLGMMEMCDIMLINKADGDLLPAARRTRGEYAKAMHLFTTRAQSYGWSPRVMLSSVKEDKERYMDNVWGHILDYEQVLLRPVTMLANEVRAELKFDTEISPTGQHIPIADSQLSVLEARRANQRVQWMWSQLNQQLLTRMQQYAKLQEIGKIEQDLIVDKITPRVAASRVFDSFLSSQIQSQVHTLKQEYEDKLQQLLAEHQQQLQKS